jgi:hypothetical protein
VQLDEPMGREEQHWLRYCCHAKLLGFGVASCSWGVRGDSSLSLALAPPLIHSPNLKDIHMTPNIPTARQLVTSISETGTADTPLDCLRRTLPEIDLRPVRDPREPDRSHSAPQTP